MEQCEYKRNSDLTALPRIEYGTTVFKTNGSGSAVMQQKIVFNKPFSVVSSAFACINNTWYPVANSVAIAEVTTTGLTISYQTNDAAGGGHIASWVAIGV